jgi:S1-C subfamily serine protease
MGILPDQEDESGAKGWRIARVMPDGAAAKAGMKDGDRILRIEGKEVNSFTDYREATGEKKPGDVVVVDVRRGDEEMNLKVELAARGG